MLLLRIFVFLSCIPLIFGEFKHTLNNLICDELPQHILEYLLGAAYNPRYMSIDKPEISENSPIISGSSIKRTASPHSFDDDFAVDPDFYQVLDNCPAWQINNHAELDRNRRFKRDAVYETQRDFRKEWHCNSKVVWKDLGFDYFPRYLRTVECLSEKCWFNLYRCKARSFTVKILRRRKGRCVQVPKNSQVGLDGLPEELRQMWVWEERAINFCCDCGR